MPATEKTARDPKLLHKLFGISGVLLLLSTFWMLSDDHARSWKEYQRTWIGLENRKTAWTEAAQSGSVNAAIESKQQELLAARAALPQREDIDRFIKQVPNESEQKQVVEAYESLKQALAPYTAARAKLKAAQDKVEELEAEQEEGAEPSDELVAAREQLALAEDAVDATLADVVAGEEAFERREALVTTMRDIIDDAKFEEDKLLRDRKFESAELDARRSRVGIAVRDSKPLEELEKAVAEQEQLVSKLNLAYQSAAARRKSLQDSLARILADEAAIQKEIDAKKLEINQLQTAINERSSTYFTSQAPFLGKRWLELPILDAFNSPRKIDNLWTDNLTIDYNFARVRRFDRCTTCHQGIDKPGGYVPEHDLHVSLATPEAAPDAKETSLEAVYGMLLGDISLTGEQEVTVHAVTADTHAAAAAVAVSATPPELLPSKEIRDSIANPFQGIEEESVPPGLQMGDRIIRIEGNEIFSVGQAQRLLMESATWGQPIQMTIRRGVPHPFTAHPRLDLFLGSLSPHPLSKFGCTSCHEGQGNATEFKWVSHTPDTLGERTEWMKEHGWFNNHHWIYPMYPERFAESGCLKCHHEVTELAASEQFPEAPAPKLTQGHELILKYGCFGCHEINGYNGSERIGPDMRLEPNFSAAALALQGEPQYDAIPDSIKDLIGQIAEHPERDAARQQLVHWLVLEQAKKAEESVLSADAKRLTDALQDVDSPGQLRKVGPSLRYASSKLDKTFMYDWLENPRDFRPSTRMPRFFGLNAHLAGSESLHTAETFQPIEILAISTYLLDRSQQYAYAEQAEGIDSGELAEQIARGKELFEIRGCLACHNHDEFPDVAQYRPEGEVPPGPDLSGLGSKFDPQRNEHGPQWLYSWIKNPSSYNPRTIMPDLKLDPIEHTAAPPAAAEAVEGTQAAEAETTTTDPIADIVAYLMSTRKEGWQAQAGLQLTQTASGQELLTKGQDALKKLSLEYLQGAYYVEDAKLYYEKGITKAEVDIESLKGAEVEMVVEAEGQMSDRQRLLYVGRKAIGKYGCYACHDIPGFEDAKPIGASLADWGRKDPSRLAFEHISEYLAHGHAAGGHHGAKPEQIPEAAQPVHSEADIAYEHGGEGMDPFYHHAVEGHERDGFIYQKLREPRSYDYHKADDKGYNEWLRMPQFPFNHQQREEVITFVLGLVADPPSAEFVYAPDPRAQALHEGKQVLAKYNCTGCHMLSVEEWKITYPPDTFPAPPPVTPETATYPFMTKEFTRQQIAATLPEAASDAGFLQAHLTGLPAINNGDARPIVEVDDGGQYFLIEEGEVHNPEELYYQFQLWDAMALDGSDYQVGSVLTLPGSMVTQREAPYGGSLTRYLLPRVLKIEKQANPNANGTEAYGWLPPPLVNQGNKTQGDWLFDFLLDPHQIRPAVFLQMPKFNMSPEESRKLVNYFAARDNASFPYEYTQRQQQEYLARQNEEYEARGSGEGGQESGTARFDAAMQIVVNKNYCVTCHLVGEYAPEGSVRAKAPNLGEVYKRLRYDYVFPWIANPKRILPYTAMPVNIPYDPTNPETLGGIPQDIYHGTSVEQVRALSDLLLNYDKYTKEKTQIDPLVQAAKAADDSTPEGEAPAGGDDPAAATSPAPATTTENPNPN